MVCGICGKTVYWCLGHPPFRVGVTNTQSTEGTYVPLCSADVETRATPASPTREEN